MADLKFTVSMDAAPVSRAVKQMEADTAGLLARVRAMGARTDAAYAARAAAAANAANEAAGSGELHARTYAKIEAMRNADTRATERWSRAQFAASKVSRALIGGGVVGIGASLALGTLNKGLAEYARVSREAAEAQAGFQLAGTQFWRDVGSSWLPSMKSLIDTAEGFGLTFWSTAKETARQDKVQAGIDANREALVRARAAIPALASEASLGALATLDPEAAAERRPWVEAEARIKAVREAVAGLTAAQQESLGVSKIIADIETEAQFRTAQAVRARFDARDAAEAEARERQKAVESQRGDLRGLIDRNRLDLLRAEGREREAKTLQIELDYREQIARVAASELLSARERAELEAEIAAQRDRALALAGAPEPEKAVAQRGVSASLQGLPAFSAGLVAQVFQGAGQATVPGLLREQTQVLRNIERKTGPAAYAP